MAKFSMTDLLNDKSKKNNGKNDFKIKLIHISKLIPNEKNFYSVDDVTELKDSILLFGLQQNLVVRETEDTNIFSVTSGHRRLKALEILVEEGHTEFELVPCKVENEIDEIKAELKLIFANATSRELNDYEKTHQAIRMKELLMALKQSGVKLTGRLREIVADTLKVSTTQVARMESIDSKLSEDFKEEFKNNKVNFSTAYELSGLENDKQKEAYQEFKDKGTISISDVKSRKATKPPKEELLKQKHLNRLINTNFTDKDLSVHITYADNLITKTEEEEIKTQEQLKIYVCSPYGGKEENYLKAFNYCKKIAEDGNIPFASHVMLHGIFDDSNKNDRELGLIAGIEMIKLVDEVRVCGVHGLDVTEGMQKEIEYAKMIGKKVTVYAEEK